MTVLQQFKNSASTTLAADITAAATSLTVSAGGGALFPTLTGSQFFYATLVSYGSSRREIVKVTARATDTFTITRAQDNSTAYAFSQGDTVELRVIAADMDLIKADIDTNTTNIATNTSGISTNTTNIASNTAAILLKANIASPTFTGTPAAPTPTASDNSTKIATTAYVDTADNLKAPLANPTFTGIVTTAGQIKFPATQNPSADGNTLDDYEEGTWTPTIAGETVAGVHTYATQTGKYTKIGRVVFIEFAVSLTTKGGTMSGNTYIGGLPFAPVSDFGGINVGNYSLLDLSVGFSQFMLRPVIALSGLYLVQGGDNNGASFTAAAALANGSVIQGGGSYFTT